MYAVIRSGGKQYKVTPGEKVRVEKLEADTGSDVDFEVLAMHDGENLELGKPLVDGATVSGKVVAHGRGRKLVVYKFKRRKGYHCKKGHRQDYTDVKIEQIAKA